MFKRINPDKLDAHVLDEIVEFLKEGAVIIYPTDTVYAMGCHIENSKGIERIAKLKNIHPDKADFSIVCHDLSHLSDYTKPISNSLFRVMKKNLPGPFTFILPAGNKLPKSFKATKKTIGIRVPDNSIARYMVEKLGAPLISASVHASEDEILEYYTEPEDIYQQFSDKIDAMVDGGYGQLVPSTVLDCTGEMIQVVRQGLGILEE